MRARGWVARAAGCRAARGPGPGRGDGASGSQAALTARWWACRWQGERPLAPGGHTADLSSPMRTPRGEEAGPAEGKMQSVEGSPAPPQPDLRPLPAGHQLEAQKDKPGGGLAPQGGHQAGHLRTGHQHNVTGRDRSAWETGRWRGTSQWTCQSHLLLCGRSDEPRGPQGAAAEDGLQQEAGGRGRRSGPVPVTQLQAHLSHSPTWLGHPWSQPRLITGSREGPMNQ